MMTGNKLTLKQKEVILAMRERRFGRTNHYYYYNVINASGNYEVRISKLTISNLIAKKLITPLFDLTRVGKTIQV